MLIVKTIINFPKMLHNNDAACLSAVVFRASRKTNRLTRQKSFLLLFGSKK